MNLIISLKFGNILTKLMTELLAFSVQKLSCKNGSTSGLFRHLKTKHSLSLNTAEQPFTSKQVKIQLKSITSLMNVKKEGLQRSDF